MTPPRPLAQGDLATTPLLHVLLSIERRRLDGTLVLWPPSPDARGQDRVRFEEGWPVAARFREPASRLDIGLLASFSREGGAYAFYAEDLVGAAEAVSGRVDPWALAAASLRLGGPRARMEDVLSRWHGVPLRLKPGFRAGRLGLLRDEASVLDLLRAAPMSLEELHRVAGAEDVVHRVVYLLVLLGGVEAHRPVARASASSRIAAARDEEDRERSDVASSGKGDRQGPLPSPDASDSSTVERSGARHASLRPGAWTDKGSGAGEEPPPPPEGLSPVHRERWIRLLEQVRTLDEANDFSLLGLEPSADVSDRDVEQAYVAVVRRCHPDSLPAPLAPLEPWARRLFHRVTEARDRLGTEEGRARVRRALQEGLDAEAIEEEERRVGVVVEAALELTKIQALVRTRQWRRAWEALERLRSAAPQEAEVVAWWAYVSWKLEGNEPSTLARVEEALEDALRLDPSCWRAHLWIGQIARQGGRWKEALAHFERAAQIVPKEVEVARELRVARLRATHEGEGEEPGEERREGVLSKWFGRRSK